MNHVKIEPSANIINLERMKQLLLAAFILICLTGFSQTGNMSMVSFVTKMDTAKAGKDGFYLHHYVVNISREQARQLQGKKIKITGVVTVVKGLGNQPSSDDIRQGREADTKHILTPTIETMQKGRWTKFPVSS